MARHLQARPLQGGDHRGAIRDGPRFDALAQIVGNRSPGVFLRRQPGPKLGGLDVGPMAGLYVPRPFRIVRAAPAVLVVLPVPQRIECLLPAGSRDIQALAGLKIAARRQDMHVHTFARFAMLDRCPGLAVRFQSRPGGFLELVHHIANLCIARVVLRCPRDDARRVLVLELKRVGHPGHLVWMAPQRSRTGEPADEMAASDPAFRGPVMVRLGLHLSALPLARGTPCSIFVAVDCGLQMNLACLPVIIINCIYNWEMTFEWDTAKNQTNIRKHGVSFETAQRIFEGSVLTWFDDRKDYGEDRYISVGKVESAALIVVAHTGRDDRIRLISARPASRKERQAYHERIR